MSPRDAALFARIDELRLRAANIRVDGKDDDWLGFPSFSDPSGDSGGDSSRDIVRVAIAPRENDLLVLIATAEKPCRDDRAFWIRVDLIGHQPPDIAVGISSRGAHVLWLYEEGHPPMKTETKDIEFAIDEVVEIRVPYSRLPASMAKALAGEVTRPWVRVFAFTWDATKQQAVDQGPAAASYRLAPTPYALDSAMEHQGSAPMAIDLPVRGKWYVLQEAFGIQTHQKDWAYDLVIRDEIGQNARVLENSRNEDHYAWGNQVYAPLQGRIVQMRDGDPDNTPGAPGSYVGNYVALDVGNGLGLLLNHFRRGSIAVASNEAVFPNTLLGMVGNSGRSALPHLHMQLYQLPNARNSVPMELANVRVSLHPGPADPWSRDLSRWMPREGFFVERLAP